MLDRITPLVLTLNESPNIGRLLKRLEWARDIVLVDSLSEDDTVDIARNHSQVRVYSRRFSNLQDQWTFGLRQTDIQTEWVLALDADYMPTPELLDELKHLMPLPTTSGYRCRFTYCVYGRPLRGSLYPPVVVLFRKDRASYRQEGHAHRVVLDGDIENLAGRMLHDDRKSISQWLKTQDIYMQQEEPVLAGQRWSALNTPDLLRRLLVPAPFAAFLYSYFLKGGFLDGLPGLHYALQRMLAEGLLSLRLIDQSLRNAPTTRTTDNGPGAGR